jgi:hypothetical protein
MPDFFVIVVIVGGINIQHQLIPFQPLQFNRIEFCVCELSSFFHEKKRNMQLFFSFISLYHSQREVM